MSRNLSKKSRLESRNGVKVGSEYVTSSILIFFVVNGDLTAELKRIQMEREKAVTRLNEINPRRSKCFVEDGMSRKGPRANETSK